VATGTTTELNLADYFKGNNMKYEIVAFGTADGNHQGLRVRRCDVFTSDVSQLYAERLKLSHPADHAVLPEVISKEPLGPMVRHGDDQWLDIVKWTLFAIGVGRRIGVTRRTSMTWRNPTSPSSSAPSAPTAISASSSASPRLVVADREGVGNYGEAFDRNVRRRLETRYCARAHQLWNKGGLQYAPPIR